MLLNFPAGIGALAGDEKAGLGPDEEAQTLWLKYLPSGRVLPFSMKVFFPLNE